MEQRLYGTEHYRQRFWLLFGNGQCQRLQQYLFGPSGDGESVASKYGDGLRPAHPLPGGKRNVERAFRVQLFVEQRRHHAKYFPNRERFLFGNRFCQRMQQHFRGPSGDGESVAFKYGDGFRPVDFLPG